ncbi:cysteine hydrolase [Frigidibacter sp. RF13]|uniref:cysteine hydrolase family protein n=1 Tax=Frigidibacter sp. RF13 TaxID=2997340 RepID=UPI002271B70A|nr:isochorismatase family cysteine hydrolase [Frigidibacter sp. RF13]MCY1127484.1 cysteine hydrolase [Frigidibacter sp. RF13]
MKNPRETSFRAGESALLFVDMQKIFCTPSLDPAHPEFGPDHYYHRRLRDTVIPNQSRLLARARATGIQVMHTIIEALTEDCRDVSLDHRLSNLMIPKGHPMAGPIDELAPIANEIVLPKTSSGVFNSTNIDYVLRNLGVRTLIVAGVVTDQCVDMAVRDAADRGYLVAVPGDACATYTQERHDGALRAYGGYCWVTETDTVLTRMEAR